MPRTRDSHAEHTMSFGDHLEELRKRLFLALAAPLPLAIVIFPFTDTLIEVLLLPLYRALRAHGLPETVQALSPPEVVVTQLKLSVLTALILSAPWMLWQAWLFISPGLYQHEKRFVNLLVPGSFILTISGLALLYYFMLPIMLNVMIGIGAGVKLQPPAAPPDARIEAALQLKRPVQIVLAAPEAPMAGDTWLVWPEWNRAYIAAVDSQGAIVTLALPAPAIGSIAQQFRLREYVGFVLVLATGTAIGFQMPLVVMLLGWIGLATPAWFRKQRRYALFFCGVAAAVITPSSDLISMLVMMLPLYLLYELGIVLLVLAPASRVARGQVFSTPRWRWGKSGNGGATGGAPARSAAAPPNTVPATKTAGDDADSSEARP